MGTRCLVRVFDGKAEILCLYRQFDGYPDGMGADLQKFLAAGGPLTNGIRGNGEPCFNGAGDLAAQLVFFLKQNEKEPSKPTIGHVYIYAPGSVDVGEEYEYHLRVPALGAQGNRGASDAPELLAFETGGSLKKIRLPKVTS